MEMSKTIKLGIFTTAAIFLFLALVVMLGKNKNWFNPRMEINGIFENVGGLYAGADVRLTGINIGEVVDIFVISDSTARVVMSVDEKYNTYIKKSAMLSIGNDGLVGDKVVNILSNKNNLKNENIQDGDYLLSYSAIDTDVVLKNVESIAYNVENITNELSMLLENINEGKGVMGALFADSTVTLDLKETIENLSNSSEKLDENMEAAQSSIFLRRYFKNKKEEKEEDKK